MHPSLRAFSFCVALGLTACVAQPPVVGANPYPPPPPLQVETRPLPPISENELIWQPGEWDWTGSAYVWTAGKWVPRAGHGTTWQDGYWAVANGGWVWVRAHWI